MAGRPRKAPGGSAYPALWIENDAKRWSLPGGGPFLLGRSRKCDLTFPDDPSVSREQVRISLSGTRFVVENLSSSTRTKVNGKEITKSRILRHGDLIRFSEVLLVFLEEADPVVENPKPGEPRSEAGRVESQSLKDGPSSERHKASTLSRKQLAARRKKQAAAAPSGTFAAPFDPGNTGTVVDGAAPQADRKPRSAGGKRKEIPLQGKMVLGRSAERADVQLDHPTVSRRHATIDLRGETAFITDLSSANGTFVNGAKLNDTAALAKNDIVDIGPFSLIFTGKSFLRQSREANMRVIGRNLTRIVSVPGSGKRTILEDVSVVIEPNEFVCLLGPSGSGKTTLMNALSAREMATKGEVLINDVSLYAHFAIIKDEMALVPQHDMLHETLTLNQALTYTARLRLPADQTRADIAEEIGRVAKSVELQERLSTKIGMLSGGQKKRASLANETLSKPSLLFLDEVTSGLDEGTDWEIMKLLRRMADDGMTIICVTHTLANVEEFCHRIVVMAEGGYLAFSGTPEAAKAHFGVEKLADIYRVLPQVPGADWRDQFVQGQTYRQHIGVEIEKLEGGTRFRERSAVDHEALDAQQWVINVFRQFMILTGRNARLLLADTKTLAMAFGQAVLLGALLGYVFIDFKSPGPLVPPFLFLFGVTAFWIGCNGTSKEIVKERPIYLRERDVNLSVLAFFSSKLLINVLFVVLQVLVLFGAVAAMAATIPGPIEKQMPIVALAGAVGACLGLLISAVSSTRDQATTLVPLALVPQIILAGVIVSEMPVLAEWLSHTVISGYWIQESLIANFQDKGTRAAEATAVLLLHAVAFAVIGCTVLFLRDRRGKR